MSAVFDWVKDIVFYLIFLTVVTHLIPNKKYEKYIRLFTGMVMIMIVMRPVVQAFSADEIFDRNFLSQLESGERMFDYGLEEEDFSGAREEWMMEEYERQMEAFVDNEARLLGMRVVSFWVKLGQEDGMIVPESIFVEVQVEEAGFDEGLRGEMGKAVEGIETVTIPEIVLDREREQEGMQVSVEQARQLQGILAQYYGVAEERVQIRCY